MADEETVTEFLRSRSRWLRVRVAPGEAGGHAVVLELDGNYATRDDALGSAVRMGERLLGALERES